MENPVLEKLANELTNTPAIGDNSKAFGIDMPGDTQLTVQPGAISAPIAAPSDAIAEATNNESPDDAIAAFRAYVVASTLAFTEAVKTAQETETMTQKQWGHKALRIAFHHKLATTDSVINDTRVIVGWDTLVGPVGKKLANSYNQWFNNLRMVSERWATLDAATQADLLNGAASISTLATRWKEAATKAKREATKAAKAIEDNAKADAADNAKPEADDTPVTMADVIAHLLDMVRDASDADILANDMAFNRLACAYAERYNLVLPESEAVNG
jgi:hypothetical protein